jgi:hypothetical protein
MKRALLIVLIVSLLGVAFSGVLAYQELSGATTATCPSPGAPGTVLGYPACVYGLFMYLVVLSAAIYGLTTGGGPGR